MNRTKNKEIKKFRKRFVVGDIHGNYKCLIQALERADFKPDEDILYGVGDYVDGHPEIFEVIEYLINLPNFRGVIGNHDFWFRDWARDADKHKTSFARNIWYNQGGKITLKSYCISTEIKMSGPITQGRIPKEHLDFFNNLEPFIELDNQRICIVHAGWELPSNGKIQDSGSWKNYDDSEYNSSKQDILWNRSFWYNADNHKNPDYDKVFIGHTQSTEYPQCKKGIIWNIDSAAGWNGCITVMDIDTEEYWQSDNAFDFYEDFMKNKW